MAQAKSTLPKEELDHDVAVKNFAGVNTQAARTAIKEEEFAWLENVMPVGYANLKCVPYQGTPVATIVGVIITYWKYVNITNVDYLICFTAGGSAHAVNLASFAVTLIGAGGTFTGPVATAQWKNERTLIVAGNGYWSWDPVGGLVSLTGVTGAPMSGQTIMTFAGRVWVGIFRTVVFSAPTSYQDFQTASSGGSFIVSDETLHSNINALVTANNFGYIVGDASFNVISDVRLGTGSPAPTVFSNTNISALIGSNLPLSIFPFYRMLAFATRYGFYVMVGSTPQKISDHLDGIVPLIDYTKPVSGGVANIFEILCMAFLFNYKDPAGARPLLAIFFNSKWFFANQGADLKLIAGAFQSGTPALFGTDGPHIYKLFSDTTSNISTIIQTALWPMKKPTSMKEAQKAGVEITTGAVTTQINLTLDSDFGTIPLILSASNSGDWINNAGVIGHWVNAGAVQGQWIISGFLIYQADAEFKGRYLGYTMRSTAPGYAVNGFLNQHQISTPWATRA
jgi:hypothetical protein